MGHKYKENKSVWLCFTSTVLCWENNRAIYVEFCAAIIDILQMGIIKGEVRELRN